MLSILKSRRVSKLLTPSVVKSIEKSRFVPFLRLPYVFLLLSIIVLIWVIYSLEPSYHISRILAQQNSDVCPDLPNPTFYDDANLTFSIGSPIKGWDEKRREWLKHHPSLAVGARDRVFVVTGSHPSPCHSKIGDYLLLRMFKNKVDYCRIHGYDMFYNNALLHPNMPYCWAKLPVVRAAMIAHPEAEWIYWVDSDAVFTDMEFKLPLEKYKDYNLVVDGWPGLIYEKRSWIGLNAGVFLIRNCQWSLDFMEVWASMSPQSPDHKQWGETLKEALNDKGYADADDQSALVYLVLTGKDTWATKIYLENKYCFQGYWLGIVGKFDNLTESYAGVENRVRTLRRRRAEKVSKCYCAQWEKALEEGGFWKETRRPFITHFTGCQPCSGYHNPNYDGDACLQGMDRALNFADNQVLRHYGFVRNDLNNFTTVSPLTFDFHS